MYKEPIKLVDDTRRCSGCGACMTVCAHQAIRMVEDSRGCKYPVIDDRVCVGCGRCRQVCSYHKPGTARASQKAYAAYGIDTGLVKRSASGGMFASLAMSWLRAGGLIAGAVMDVDDGVQVYHILSGKAEDVSRMQGSKYVHSDAWRCYGDVLAMLRSGRQVLFSGTPCQVAAVKALSGDPDNLTTIDLICHGVPPAAMLDDYVKLLGKRLHGRVEGLSFRDKSISRDFCARIDVRRGKKRRSYYLRSGILSFYKYFLQGMTYRDNCYTCPYARMERVSDVTIGDYWGIEKQHGEDIRAGRMPERKDWSCVLANTEKGQRLLDAHAGEIVTYASQAEWIARENHQLQHPTAEPEGRSALIRRYRKDGYAGVEADFMRQCGGKLRYHFRLYRQVRENDKARKTNEGSAT
ncbi:MAG: Coenzyme F420 hydrogenase/dehydrogenase, beta subunit C-terminal domain [Clostridia bacterium]|nr:Coenzyme F420 hydrogenase/dehydrogenase, beta subunit C-terminal domain [Clostridia bacterium]